MIASQKSFCIISSSLVLVKMPWNVSRVSGPTALKISGGRPSNHYAWPMLVCLIVFLTYSKVAGRSKSSMIVYCRIKPRDVVSTVEGLLSR